MAVTRKEFAANTVLTAAEVNTIQDNGVIQVGSEEEMEALPDTVKICYRTDKTETWMMLGVTWTRITTTNDVEVINGIIDDFKEKFNVACPVGTIQMFYRPTNEIPRGWLLCNGQARPSWAIYGGAIPDLRGRVPAGVSGTQAGNSGGISVDNVSLGQQFGHDNGRFRQQYQHSYHSRPRGYYGSPPDWDTITSISHNHQHHIPVRSISASWKSSAKWCYQSAPTSHGLTGYVTSGHHHDLYMSPNHSTAASWDTYVTQPSLGINFIIYVGDNRL